MRELPAGSDAVLLDFGTDPDAAASVRRATALLHTALVAGRLPGICDVVPSAKTILVQAEPGVGVDSLALRRALHRRPAEPDDAAAEPPTVRIPVRYDGEDLAEIADLLQRPATEVVELHRTTRWRVQFMGFAPGFGYLVPDLGDLTGTPEDPFARIGRRRQSRPAVPSGAVAIAAGYSAIYPRSSPGGWYLLGRTDRTLWDTTRRPPALLTPGAVVEFVDADRDD